MRRNSQAKSKKTIRLLIVMATCIVLSAINYCRSEQHSGNHERRFATPSDSLTAALLQVDIPDSIPCHPIEYTGMNIGFNPRLHIPNWVAWQLTADEADGEEPRTNKFFADERVPGSAESYDYNYSGYDRGHMAPAGDMKWDKNAISESFFMTNIVPQAKALNSGAWKRLEEKCRTWARVYGNIYIVCGPVTSDQPIEYIGDSRVFVPQRFFKAVIAIDTDRPRGIGFIMPNGKVPGGMQQSAVTIDEIERITGYDLFAALPDEIENEIESQCDFHYWSTLKTPRK
ncbi:MAG: DNA/RNA non-specific endonuclease [Duncaniella sp.]|nr:DNA/RNA non-specific endonuclease [Duncaniella sp.]